MYELVGDIVKKSNLRPTKKKKYDQSDLSNLKVSHRFEDFQEGREHLLVLKDINVLDENSDDELVDISVAEKERLEKNLKNKKFTSRYFGYDDDEFERNNAFDERKILAKYDEETSDSFTLGSLSSTKQKQELPFNTVSLDTSIAIKQASDYYTNEEMATFKKTKKRKKPRTKDLDEGDSLMEDRTEQSFSNDNFIDDEDLQASLARSRRLEIIKMKKTEEIAREVLESKQTSMEETPKGLVISETTEFVNSLLALKEDDKPIEAIKKNVPEIVDVPEELKVEMEVEKDIEQTNPTEPSEIVEKTEEIEETVFEDDLLVNQGVGATLNLLLRQGVIAKSDTKDNRDAEDAVKKQQWTIQHNLIEKLKEQERSSFKNNKNQRSKSDYTKFQEKEKELTKIQADKFKDYKPQVNLEYVDDYGRKLNQKEAFKHLCYQFHGRKPGKNKTEKLLKKIEEEKKVLVQTESSSSIESMKMLERTQEEMKSAGVIVSVGNRVVLPENLPTDLIQKKKVQFGLKKKPNKNK